MQSGWILAAVIAAGHVVAEPAAAVPLAAGPLVAVPLVAGGTADAPPRPDLVLVQSGDPAVPGERMHRLMQHRAIIENALTPRSALAPQPLEPQTQPLQPPLEDTPPEPEWAGEADEAIGLVDCEAAAAIVADYGFSDVRPRDCGGDLFTFSAMRDGTAYALSVTPDGEIAEVARQ